MTVAASHEDEVQVITTSAPKIVSVQLLTTSANEGEAVTGHFGLHFPEKQKVRKYGDDISKEATRSNEQEGKTL